jgi:Holliday junction resolvase
MARKKNPSEILNLENEFYKKPRINSRTKGNTFERAIAKKLNARFNTKEFCRTPGSGAFATTHTLPDYLQVHGDLITPKDFTFIIEAKRGYDLKFEDIWKPKSKLFEFIAQASRDGEAAKKPWLLVYKKDRQKEIVISPVKFPTNHKAIIKDYFLYLLEDLLTVGDDFFFKDID